MSKGSKIIFLPSIPLKFVLERKIEKVYNVVDIERWQRAIIRLGHLLPSQPAASLRGSNSQLFLEQTLAILGNKIILLHKLLNV